MTKSFQQLIEDYAPMGTVKAGEMLVPPSAALAFAERLEELGAFILGLGFWFSVDAGLMEGLDSLDLSGLQDDDDRVKQAVEAVKRVISRPLPPDLAFISFVVDDPRYWEATKKII